MFKYIYLRGIAYFTTTEDLQKCRATTRTLHNCRAELPCKHQSLSTNRQFGRANEAHSKRELGLLLYLSDMKTHDASDRMKNMDTVKQLATPKSSRLLVEERPIVPPDSSTQAGRRKPAHPPLTKIWRARLLSGDWVTFCILARIARVERKGRGSWFSMMLYYNASGQASPPSLSCLLQIQEQIRNQSCKQRQVCYHRKQRVYRFIKVKQKVMLSAPQAEWAPL